RSGPMDGAPVVWCARNRLPPRVMKAPRKRAGNPWPREAKRHQVVEGLVVLVEVDRTADRSLAELGGELVDRLAEPFALGPGGLVEAELARRVAWLELGRRAAAQPDPPALARLDRDLGEQLDRRAREDAAVAGRGVERGAPRDLTEVVVLDDQHHGAGAQVGRAQPGRDPVGLIEEQHGELALVRNVVLEGLLVADRDRIALGDDGSVVLAAGERREVVAGGRAEPGDQRGLGVARDVADRLKAHRREDLAGGVADAPQPGHRERVEEAEQLIGWHDAQAVRLV